MHWNGTRVRPLVGLAFIAVLAPFAQHPLDWLLVVELGLSGLLLVGMFEFLVRFSIHTRLWATRVPDKRPPTALHPSVAWLIAISTIFWAIGGTAAVVEAFAHHYRALHLTTIFGLLAQPVTLAWLYLFISALEREERDEQHRRRNGNPVERLEDREG